MPSFIDMVAAVQSSNSWPELVYRFTDSWCCGPHKEGNKSAREISKNIKTILNCC